MPAPTLMPRGRGLPGSAALAVTALLVIAACRDATVPDAVGPEETAIARRRLPSHELTTENSEWKRRFEADAATDCYTRRFNEADTLGVGDGLNSPSCPSQMVATPNSGDGTFWLWHSPAAVDGNGSADSLVVTFSHPVGMLAILRSGTHSCYDSTIGQVVAYGPGNVELGRSPFNLIQTCSDALPVLREGPTASSRGVSAASSAPYTSPYAPSAEAVLPIPSGVTRLVFLPPEEWYFTYVDPYFPDNVQHLTRQGTYYLIFRADSHAAGHVKITVDSATLTQGDTTVFRVTAPGATQWTVTGYHFVPVVGGVALAMRGPTALRAPASAGMRTPATERARPLPAPRNSHFLDAAFECSEATVALCYDDPPQTGYEVVTAMVDGEAQRDSVLVTVEQPTLVLELKDSRGQPLSATALTPSVTTASLRGGSGLNCRVQGALVDSRMGLTLSAWRVRNGVRSPAAGVGVSVTLSHDEGDDGGHKHAASRPIGSFLPESADTSREATTASDGTTNLTYFAPVAAGLVRVQATVNGVTIRESIRVARSDLVELSSLSPYYSRVGATSTHPSSFYGQPALIAALIEAARLFKIETGVSLGVNDMSLAEGGVFDLSLDWRKPHCGHRVGVSADIQTRTLNSEQRRSILAIWANLGGSVLQEGDHYHFTETRR